MWLGGKRFLLEMEGYEEDGEARRRMKRWIGTLMVFAICAGCAGGQQARPGVQGIVFETGKSRRAVMDAIVEVAVDDGYTIAATSDAEGTVVCDPRHMLEGILKQKMSGEEWGLTSKKATLNQLIQFSARVSEDGVVELKTLVMVSGAEGSADPVASERLARYYEKRILKVLRTTRPRPLGDRGGTVRDGRRTDAVLPAS